MDTFCKRKSHIDFLSFSKKPRRKVEANWMEQSLFVDFGTDAFVGFLNELEIWRAI